MKITDFDFEVGKDYKIRCMKMPSNYNTAFVFEDGKEVYKQSSNGSCVRRKYDENGFLIFEGIVRDGQDYEWSKWEYDKNGNQTYYEASNSYWDRSSYDKNNNMTYYEDCEGFWERWEYDETGSVVYYENSRGKEVGTREVIELTMREIADILGVDVGKLKIKGV